jgi:hypothetical protein
MLWNNAEYCARPSHDEHIASHYTISLSRALLVRLLPMCHLFPRNPTKNVSYLQQHQIMAAMNNNGMQTSVASIMLTSGGKIYLYIT